MLVTRRMRPLRIKGADHPSDRAALSLVEQRTGSRRCRQRTDWLRGRPQCVHSGIESLHRHDRTGPQAARAAGTSPAAAWCKKLPPDRTDAICRRRGTSRNGKHGFKAAESQRREQLDDADGKGFFTDTTLCIGCKACEVACKQWNQLPDDGFLFPECRTTTRFISARPRGVTWHSSSALCRLHPQHDGAFSWLFSSDVCKHCARAGCLESCPTGAIIRTEFGAVYVQPDICNGCGYCIVNCPFGVIDRREEDGRAWKCTLCYDRLREDMMPACAKACPTESIQFGDLEDLAGTGRTSASKNCTKRAWMSLLIRGETLKEQPGTEGLNAFFLLVDKPEVYNLPPDPGSSNQESGRCLEDDGNDRSRHAAGWPRQCILRLQTEGCMSETPLYKDSVDPVYTDGRDIDQSVGELSGEGSQQKASGAAGKHIKSYAQKWRALPEPDAADPTYYDRPMLNDPFGSGPSPLTTTSVD